MKRENKNINPYTAADVQNYVEGKLSAAEMHAIEKAALEDPFLADAIEGFENSLRKYGAEFLSVDINDLHKKLNEKIYSREKKIFLPINRQLQVAATVIILVGIVALTYTLNTKNTSKKSVVQSKEKNLSDISKEKSKTATVNSMDDTSGLKNVVAANEQNEKKVSVFTNEAKKKIENRGTGNPNSKLRKDSPVLVSNASQVQKEPEYKSADITNSKDSISKSDKNLAANTNTPNTAAGINITRANISNIITGKVVDINNKPIIGATIISKNENLATVTDDNGMFRINIKNRDSALNVTVHSVGFETTEAILLNDNDIAGNTINLKSNRSSLNEVVVTGYGAKRKNTPKDFASENTLKNVVPANGWQAYMDYIAKNKKFTPDSSGIKIFEVVSFTIKANGHLSNFNIEQSYNDDYDAEAIRLIKNGPAWKLLKGKKARATLTIEF